MLKRAYRLRKNSEFQKVYKTGKRFSSNNFTLNYTNSYLDYSQIGVVISKKVSKKAVIRNRLRRRVNAVLWEIYTKIKRPYRVVIIIRKDFSGLNQEELKQEIQGLTKVITR